MNVACSLVRLRMMVEILEADVYEVLDLDLYSTDEHAVRNTNTVTLTQQ